MCLLEGECTLAEEAAGTDCKKGQMGENKSFELPGEEESHRGEDTVREGGQGDWHSLSLPEKEHTVSSMKGQKAEEGPLRERRLRG